MGRLSASLVAFALLATAALALSACGGGGEDAKLLPGSTASEITANLDRVKQMVGSHDCVAAEDAAQLVATQVDELGGVDKKLKQALREGAARLGEVVSECVEETTEAVEPSEPALESTTAKPAKKEKKTKASETTSPETAAPTLPPQANGKGKGLGNGEGNGPPGTEEGGGTGAPSGGVGPGSPVGEGNR